MKHGNFSQCRCDKCTQEREDEQTLVLVQRKSVTLADLYRKGRAQGLLRVSHY